MQKWQQWEAASEADWGTAVRREAVIRPLAERTQLSVDDIHDAMGQLGPGDSDRTFLSGSAGDLYLEFTGKNSDGRKSGTNTWSLRISHLKCKQNH